MMRSALAKISIGLLAFLLGCQTYPKLPGGACSVVYKLSVHNGYGGSEYVCLKGDLDATGSLVVNWADVNGTTTFVSWKASAEDLVAVHDTLSRMKFWEMRTDTNLAIRMFDPSFVRIDVQVDDQSHSVTRVYQDTDALDLHLFQQIMIAILNTVPIVSDRESIVQEMLRVLRTEEGVKISRDSQKPQQGLLVAISTNNVVSESFFFNGQKRTVVKYPYPE